MTQHVIDTFPTSAQRTRSDGSTEVVDITLGTGHDDAGRALFGEVAPEVRGYPREFTHRTYLLDENLDLRGMSQRGLLLDAGGPDGTDRLVVPPGRFGAALSTLDAPVAALRPGSRPTISHGAVGPRIPSDVLERDDASGSVRVIDPSPSTQLSREEGTRLSADVWFDAAGGIDLDRTGYIDGDVRRLSAGTVCDWMDDRAAGPVEAARIAPEEDLSSSQSIEESLSSFLHAEDIPFNTSLESPEERAEISASCFDEQEFLDQTVDVGMGLDHDGSILVGQVMRGPHNDDDLWFAVPEKGAESRWSFEDTTTGSGRRIRTLVPWSLDDPRHRQALERLSGGRSSEAAALREHLGHDPRTAALSDASVRAQVEFEEKDSRRENAVAAETPYDPFDAARDAAMDPPDEDPSFDELVVLEVNAASRDGDDARRAQIFGLAARQATAEDYIDQRNPHHPDTPALAERVHRSGIDAYDALYTRERIAEVSLKIAGDLKSFGIADPVAEAQKQSMSAESSARAVDRLSSGYERASAELTREDQLG